jgi:hypothetical protein
MQSFQTSATHGVGVQMTGLPGELWEYLTIWAIGTILGVTKDGDMKFTHEYERARLQVLVLDPSLIPQSIAVVIGGGGFIYELHFRVERVEMTHPVPIDMDDDMMEDREEEGAGRGNNSKSMQQDQSATRDGRANSSAGNAEVKSKHTHHGKNVLYHFLGLEELQDLAHSTISDGEEVMSGGDIPDSEPPSLAMHEEQIAAILEIDTPGQRSKRRAETVDESSLERTEQMKAT